jgi:hypothetical protein
VNSYYTSGNFQRIIVSPCAGRCETESLSNDLVLCLDIDRRALYSGRLVGKVMKQTNIIRFYFDMSNGLLQLLTRLKNKIGAPVVVLFQHPSPSMLEKSRTAIANAGSDCIKALQQSLIVSVHFVFDYRKDKKCWSKELLYSAFTNNLNGNVATGVKASASVTISEFKETLVKHPVFGNVSRVGWAKMKKGSEMTFFLTKK